MKITLFLLTLCVHFSYIQFFLPVQASGMILSHSNGLTIPGNLTVNNVNILDTINQLQNQIQSLLKVQNNWVTLWDSGSNDVTCASISVVTPIGFVASGSPAARISTAQANGAGSNIVCNTAGTGGTPSATTCTLQQGTYYLQAQVPIYQSGTNSYSYLGYYWYVLSNPAAGYSTNTFIGTTGRTLIGVPSTTVEETPMIATATLVVPAGQTLNIQVAVNAPTGCTSSAFFDERWAKIQQVSL